MKAYKRIISVFFAFAILICIVSPARADYHSTSNIWQWIADSTGSIPQHILGYITGSSVCPESNDAKHHASDCVLDGVAGHYVCTCDVCGQTFVATYSDVGNAYDDYVNDLTFKGIDNSGCFLWTPTPLDLTNDSSLGKSNFSHQDNANWNFDFYYNSFPYEKYSNVSPYPLLDKFYIDGNSLVFYKYIGDNGIVRALQYAVTPKVVAPIDGIYVVKEHGAYYVQYYTVGSSSGVILDATANGSYSRNIMAGDVLSCPQSSKTLPKITDVYYQTIVCRYSFPTFIVTPLNFNDTNNVYSVDYRPTSITGDYSVVGDNNEVTVFDETIFNEDNSTFYNPVTGDTHNIENWTYDYSTRTYTMTDENDNSSTLTYGDDNIVINDGGNTFYLYYGDITQNGGSGDNGGGSSSGSGLFSKIGSLLGSIVGGVLDIIEAFLSKILDHLISLAELIGDKLSDIVEMILGWFDEIPRLFTGFLAFLSDIFPFIPEEVMILLTFGIAAVVFICIIKALWRR